MQRLLWLAAVLACLAQRPTLAAPAITQLQRIGSVRVRMTEAELREALGPAAHQGPFESDATSGWTNKTWTYSGKGLKVRLTSDGSPRKPWIVCGITATEPCQLRTSRGLKLGSTRQEVEAAYKGEIDDSASAVDMIVVGKAEDGVIFRFRDGKAVEINLGPSAP